MTLVAIVDIETTGVNPFRHDRIVELAAVVMRVDGEIIREFTSLVNPERDIGPTSIHGLMSGDVLTAPHFGDLAGEFLKTLDGCAVLGAHNVRFEQMFLASEFERLGHEFPVVPTICTLELSGGGSLIACCELFGIEMQRPIHSAIHDARATASLLAKLLADNPVRARDLSKLLPISWPNVPATALRPVSRIEVRQLQSAPPPYLKKLLQGLEKSFPAETDDSSTLAYLALLDRVLEDRQVTDSEGQTLIDMAGRWGLGGTQIWEIHRDYFHRLCATALADGVVTDAERRDLQDVARLLGVEFASLDDSLIEAARKLATVETPMHVAAMDRNELRGKRVCFTGESQCRLSGMVFTREMQESMAAHHGFLVVPSVTKKTELLVVSDPNTQSGKAKKARQYGIRVIHEPLFWKALGVEIQ